MDIKERIRNASTEEVANIVLSCLQEEDGLSLIETFIDVQEVLAEDVSKLKAWHDADKPEWFFNKLEGMDVTYFIQRLEERGALVYSKDGVPGGTIGNALMSEAIEYEKLNEDV